MYITVHWMMFCVFIQVSLLWCHVLQSFLKVIGVNVSEIQLNSCMHLVKSFMPGYLYTSDRLSKGLFQKLNRMKVIKDYKGHT